MFDEIKEKLLAQVTAACDGTETTVASITKDHLVLTSTVVDSIEAQLKALDKFIHNRIRDTTSSDYINTAITAYFAEQAKPPSPDAINVEADLLKQRILAKYLACLSNLYNFPYTALTSADQGPLVKEAVKNLYAALHKNFVLSETEIKERKQKMDTYISSWVTQLKTKFKDEVLLNIQNTQWSGWSGKCPATVCNIVSVAHDKSLALEQKYSLIKSTIDQNYKAASWSQTHCTASFYSTQKERLNQSTTREIEIKNMLVEYARLFKSNQKNMAVDISKFSADDLVSHSNESALDMYPRLGSIDNSLG